MRETASSVANRGAYQRADGRALSLADWEALTWRGSRGSAEPDGSGVRYEMTSGASDVIAIDIDEGKLAFAQRLGATAVWGQY